MDLSKEECKTAVVKSSPISQNNLFLTVDSDKGFRTSAFSPYQKNQKAPTLQPFDGKQDYFMEEAQRYFPSFFSTLGHPDDALLSALPPLPNASLLRQPPTKNSLSKTQFSEMKKEYAIPTKAPPSKPQCYCSCCNQWKLYFDPPRSEFYSQSIPRLCSCAHCRDWHVYLHFTHNTQIGYYDKMLFTPARADSKLKKRKPRVPRRARGGAAGASRDQGGVLDNKENSDSTPSTSSGRGRRKKEGRGGGQFTQKSLMKKDPTLKLNNGFLPQIPYLTPLDS